MDYLHILLDAQSRGTLVCPQCAAVQTINLREQYPQMCTMIGEKRATLPCRCGAGVPVWFEVRRQPRTPVQLQGTLSDHQTGALLGTMVITSLSVSGLGFRVVSPRRLYRGARYTACFHLDDAEQSYIEATIIIRRVANSTVGATFYPEDAYNYALDFYVSDYLADELDVPAYA